MTDRPALRWIIDHDDTLRTRTRINDLHDLAAGVVVAHPRPVPRRLAYDLLIAVDKDFRSPGWPGGPGRAWKLAELWLAAEAVRHVIVYGAHRLTPNDLERLADLAAPHATLWLLTYNSQQASVPERSSMTELFAACSRRVGPSDRGETTPRSGPAVACASANFVSFRAACWHLLGPGSLFAFEDRLSEVMWSAQRWVSERHFHPDGWDAGALLEQLLGDARDQEDALVIMRAVQLAFFEQGYLLTADAARVCDASRLIINRPTGDSGVAALRRVSDPTLTALGALTTCTPFDSHRLAQLRLESLDSAAEHVTSEGIDCDVPAQLRGLVRAQLLHRTAQGANRDDALLADRSGGPCTPRRIRDLATRAHRHTLAGRIPRHVDRGGHHLGDLLTVHRLRRSGPSHAGARGLPAE